MALAIRVVDRNCAPVEGAIVDVWQCDAIGLYSGHDVNPDLPLDVSGPQRGATRGSDMLERYLRRVLATDAEGIAEFDMIYPGFYVGRAIHTQYKVPVGDKAYPTAQALYPEGINARAMAADPYNTARSITRTMNGDDPAIIEDAGLFTVFERGGRLLSVIDLGIQR